MKAAHHFPAAPPLAGLLADMRAETAQLAAQAGVVAMLHALIMSCLVRLVMRLDHLMTLWQSGQLPTPASKAVIPGAAKAPGFRPAPHSIFTPGFRLPRRLPAPDEPIPAPIAITPTAAGSLRAAAPVPRTAPAGAPDRTRRHRISRHHIRRRKPPWPWFQIGPCAPTPHCDQIIPIS